MSDALDVYENFMGGRRYSARIGGYSRVEQSDPRLELPEEDWSLPFGLDARSQWSSAATPEPGHCAASPKQKGNSYLGQWPDTIGVRASTLTPKEQRVACLRNTPLKAAEFQSQGFTRVQTSPIRNEPGWTHSWLRTAS